MIAFSSNMQASGARTLPRDEVTDRILAYLVQHPMAQDTLEGIVDWWLVEQEVRWQTATVKEALADLITEGLVIQQKGKDSRVRYRINPRKLKDVEKRIGKKAGDS